LRKDPKTQLRKERLQTGKKKRETLCPYPPWRKGRGVNHLLRAKIDVIGNY